MIDAYVINLDRQIENYSKVENAMNDIGGFNIQRVSAIDGKRGDHLESVDSETMWLCKETCPNSVIAIAMSHKKVAKMILDSGVDYALVLEDDAIPIKGGFHEKLQRTLTEVPDDWDVINLYCQGVCPKNSIRMSLGGGSAVAILVSRSGAQKIVDMKIMTHIDFQSNFILRKYKSRYNLFETDESDSTNRATSLTPSASVKQFMMPNEHTIQYKFVKLFGFDWIFDDFLNFVIYLIGFLLILFLKL